MPFSALKFFGHLGHLYEELEESAAPITPANGYITEDTLFFYVAEDGTTFYVQE